MSRSKYHEDFRVGEYILYTDGGNTNNRRGYCGAVLTDPHGTILDARGRHLGSNVTNNIAEYNGVLLGLELAPESALRIVLRSDSQLIVRQITYLYACTAPTLRGLRDKVHELTRKKFDGRVDFEWIRRGRNSADKICKQLNRGATGAEAAQFVKNFQHVHEYAGPQVATHKDEVQ